MSERERVEAEAREWYPADDVTVAGIHMGDLMENLQAAFIAGRTATAEEVEAAARSMAWILNEWEDGQVVWESPEDVAEEIAECKPLARAAFRAAGLLIEGEEAHHDL